MPTTCPKRRSAAVIHGQQQSVIAPAELHQQPQAIGPRVLPKLAVAHGPWSAGTGRTLAEGVAYTRRNRSLTPP